MQRAKPVVYTCPAHYLLGLWQKVLAHLQLQPTYWCWLAAGVAVSFSGRLQARFVGVNQLLHFPSHVCYCHQRIGEP